MTCTSTLCAATLLASFANLPHANVGPLLDRLAAAAQIVHVDAADVQTDLDRHDADLAAVARRVGILQRRAVGLDAVLTGLSNRHSELPPAHREVLQLARHAVTSMLVLLDDKADLLSRSDTDRIDLHVLRTKAHGVRARAALVELVTVLGR